MRVGWVIPLQTTEPKSCAGGNIGGPGVGPSDSDVCFVRVRASTSAAFEAADVLHTDQDDPLTGVRLNRLRSVISNPGSISPPVSTPDASRMSVLVGDV